MCMLRAALEKATETPLGNMLSEKVKTSNKAAEFAGTSPQTSTPSSSGSYRIGSGGGVNTKGSSGSSIRKMNTGTQRLRIPLRGSS
jgi:hypothetical protein